jgi:hypothetical protein
MLASRRQKKNPKNNMTFIHPAEGGNDDINFSAMKDIMNEAIANEAKTPESKIEGALKYLRTLEPVTLVTLRTKEETVVKPASVIIKYLETMEDTDDPSDFIVSLAE